MMQITLIATNTYSMGNIYNLMGLDSVHCILTSDILSLSSDLKHFENLCFALNYTLVMNNIINDLKSKYVESYY